MNELPKNRHMAQTEELRELASLYALDVLPYDERARYEAHLSAGCEICLAEVASLRRVSAVIGMTVDPVAPRPALRERLMRTIGETPQSTSPARGVLYQKDGVLIARHAEMDWKAGGLPGIFQKTLFYEKEGGFSTSMIRMTAGTHYPSHQHAGVEELYLLEGDLRVGNLVMRAGDYCRGEAGSIHEEIFTNEGCLFMVTSCSRDQRTLMWSDGSVRP